MEKLSGLVLDAYDDAQGAVMREIYSPGEAPELLKEAQALTAAERDQLPDHSFALVLVDGPVELKKFATVDAGNTVLSVEYFLKTAHKLPAEAQKVAAVNLVEACGWYDLEVPEELTKVALGALALGTAALLAPGALGQASANMKATKGQSRIMRPSQMQARSARYR